MSAIPATFRAFVAEQAGADVYRGVRPFAESDLPMGEVEIRILWSGVNYKDGLATIARGKVARISPLIAGVDLAGEVIASADPTIPTGTAVVAHGYDLGVGRHGGFADYQRVAAGWVVPLPARLTPRLAMALGTAGFTAALSVVRLEERGLRPGTGPVLVTGASGGLGTVAVGILAARGYEVVAATGKPDEADRLKGLGAAAVVDRAEVTAESARALEAERWAGAVDCVGGATLPYILRTLRHDAAVAACGNTGGPGFATTVFPFILRGAAVIGIDSVPVPIAERRTIWQRLADDLRPSGLGGGVTEVTLDTLDGALDGILAGRARGRWLVRIGDEAGVA